MRKTMARRKRRPDLERLLRELGLERMAGALDQRLRQSKYGGWSHQQLLAELLEEELVGRAPRPPAEAPTPDSDIKPGDEEEAPDVTA
jgi:hypothetical protein